MNRQEIVTFAAGRKPHQVSGWISVDGDFFPNEVGDGTHGANAVDIAENRLSELIPEGIARSKTPTKDLLRAGWVCVLSGSQFQVGPMGTTQGARGTVHTITAVCGAAAGGITWETWHGEVDSYSRVFPVLAIDIVTGGVV
jgi:hypothetical protein